ncbi:MAG: serine/threonine protein kinase [Verrucomicrobia bacterium]|nr:serine/threonine protein kinase [Verrucomicrobiota bacterium]
MIETLPPGPYQVLARIASGTTSDVYRARRLGHITDVALKVLAKSLTTDAAWLRRFQREAHLLRQLRHPNTVALLDYGQHQDRWFMALELVEGRVLRDWVGTRAKAGLLVRVGGQIAAGLAAAHALGLVHRDLKPANVMVSDDGRVKILDFGLARPVAATHPEFPTTFQDLTRTGAVMGTPRYMSPEQSLGQTLCPASDLFCLGLCLYELACGVHPFASPFVQEVVAGIRENPTPDLTRRRPDLPPALIQLIGRMLHKIPAQRPPAQEVFLQLSELARTH